MVSSESRKIHVNYTSIQFSNRPTDSRLREMAEKRKQNNGDGLKLEKSGNTIILASLEEGLSLARIRLNIILKTSSYVD